MNKNFKFSDFISISFQDDTLDLHNDYDLSRLIVDNSNHECSIVWKSNRFCRSDITEIEIVFTDVSRLAYNMSFDEEGVSLRFAGYLPNEDFGSNSYFISEEDSGQNDHMILSFENESFVSILASSAIITVRRTELP